MLEQIVAFSLRQRLLILLVYILLAAIGVWLTVRLPIDAFPDTTPVQVQINTTAPALNGEEIEQQVTLPIELEIGGLPGLIEVRSISKFGLSQVVATFDDATRIEDARQFISERLASVELPTGIDRPQLGPMSTGLGEVFHYIVRSENPNRTLEELRTLHDWVVKPELRTTSGVAEVNSWGGEAKQYHIIIAPEALVQYDLTMRDVQEAIERNNANVGGGVITSGGQSLLVHGLGRVQTLDEIGSIVIASHEGAPIFIRDVTEDIRIDHEIRRGAITAQGRGEAVLGLAFMLMGENAQQVTEALKTKLASVQRALPDDVILETVYDRTELTREVIRTVQHNLLAGAILVVLALFLIFGNIRAGLLVAITIPLAMVFAVYGMTEFAIAASLLSLGAIDFGILIDGSVVMTESNLRSLRERATALGRKITREERLETVLASSRDVARPIAFGLGIIALVFVPVLTLEGVEGKMFKPMAFTFIFALAGALIIALTLSPVLSYYTLPGRPKRGEGIIASILTAIYAPILTLSMKLRWIMLPVVLAILIGAGFLAMRLGGEFIPRLSEGAIAINIIRLAGVSIDESVRYNTRIEQQLLAAFPDEIRDLWSRIGTAEVATDPMGTELTDIFIALHPREQWKRATTQAELVAAMQRELEDLPGLNMVFSQPIELRINEMASGIRSDLGIKIYGENFDELIRISDDIQRILLTIPGATDIAADQITGQPTLRIEVDQAALARFGVPADDVLAFVEAVGGIHVGEIFEQQRSFPLIMRLPDRHRTQTETLASTIIPTTAGPRLPLTTLARVNEGEGASTINREWGRRLIRVQCNVAGRDVTSFIREAQQRMNREIILPDGYLIDWGGQFENLERARLRLAIVVPATLALVFFILYFSLGRLRDVLLISTAIPFAAVGGIAALWYRDIPFSVSAAIGFIALGGIAVLNGQILITAIRSFLDAGHNPRDAITLAAKQRLRPVLATAITDALGFIPMAISTGIGAEVQRPLATVVIGGVITSTVLTLLVLPSLSLLIGPKHPRNTTNEPRQ